MASKCWVFPVLQLEWPKKNKVLLMHVDAVDWVVYQVLVAAFLGMLRLPLDLFVVFSDASEVTFMQASRILRRQL